MHLRWTNARFCVLCVRMNHFEALMVSSGEKRLQSSQDGNLVKGSLLEKGKMANEMLYILDVFSSV